MTILNHLPKLTLMGVHPGEGLKPHRHYHVRFDGVEDPEKRRGSLHDVRFLSSFAGRTAKK